MLPKRIPKKPKRASRWRSQAHCNFVRSHHCCVPFCNGLPIEVAHVRVGSGAGVGQKPDDWNTISLCREHHAEQHAIGETSFQYKHSISFGELTRHFIKASPKRREIEEIRSTRSRGESLTSSPGQT